MNNTIGPKGDDVVPRRDPQVLKMVKDLTGRRGDDTERHPPAPPDLEGDLSKLKHKTSILGSWNRRYFRVDAPTRSLRYYNNRQDYERGERPKDAIDLVDISAVRKFDDTSFQIEASARTYLLRADSKAEFTCWTTALQEYLELRQDFDRWKTTYDNAQRSLS